MAYLASEQNHTSDAVRQRAFHSHCKHDDINKLEDDEQRVDENVKEGQRAGIDCLIYGFNTVGHKPMETFDEMEEAKHEGERDVKLITEDGESQEKFGNEHPCPFVEMLRRHER